MRRKILIGMNDSSEIELYWATCGKSWQRFIRERKLTPVAPRVQGQKFVVNDF